MSKTIGIFQFNGCSKCFNETLLLNDPNFEIVRISDPTTWDPQKLDYSVITGFLLDSDKDNIEKIKINSSEMIGFGSCATYGGIFGLNYQRGIKVLPLKKLIESPIEVPSCLGEVDTLTEVLKGVPKSRVENLCKVCLRESTCDFLEEVKRQIDLTEEENKCYNDLGFMCAGYVAKECNERCINFGAPCRGCKPSVERSGFRQMALFSTLMGNIEVATEATGKGGTDKLADVDDDITEANLDVTGNFFRFTLADSTMPIGRNPSSGNLIQDVYNGRLIEELPLLLGCAGGLNFISHTIDAIEAVEKITEMEISEITIQFRMKLRQLESELQKSIIDNDSEKYKNITRDIRKIAGNMNLSNVFFGGFKTPIDEEADFESYKSQIFEIQAGNYQSGKISFSLDEKGLISNFAMEE